MAKNPLDSQEVNARWSAIGEEFYSIDDYRVPSVNSEDGSFSQSKVSNPESLDYSEQIYEKAYIHDFNPLAKTRLAINYSGDDADVPLLKNSEGYGVVPYEGSERCREPMPVTNSKAWKKLAAATSVCLLFMMIELIGGHIAGSLAVMTDAAHLLSDCVGFLVSLFAVWVAGQPPNGKFTYGYHRAEVLGALLSILVIWILTGVFAYLAICRLLLSDFEIHADAMMIVAGIGIAINIVMGCILHDGMHFHFHGGDVGSLSSSSGGFATPHHHHVSARPAPPSINVRAAIIHVFGDLIQSIGVFISAVVINFYPEAKAVDPVCTFICCILVIASTIGVLRESVWVLLETVPRDLDTGALTSALMSLDGVLSVHSLHLWVLSPGHYVLTAHICVGGLTDRDIVLENAQRMLSTKYGVDRVTLQVERHAAHVLAQ